MAINNQFKVIYASNGQPFVDFKAASFMRNQLNAIAPEYTFVVLEHPDGGFVLQQTCEVNHPHGERSLRGDSYQQTGKSEEAPSDPLSAVTPETRRFIGSLPMVIRPAIRVHIVKWFLVFFFVFLGYQTQNIMNMLLPYNALIKIKQYVPDFALYITAFMFVMALYNALIILLSVYSREYSIYKDGVKERVGIISRDAHAIKFRNVRGVGLEQSLVDRLLGVGTIEFYTAGSDGADVVFRRIPKAVLIRDYLDEYASACK